jgi:hypothetical protein
MVYPKTTITKCTSYCHFFYLTRAKVLPNIGKYQAIVHLVLGRRGLEKKSGVKVKETAERLMLLFM